MFKRGAYVDEKGVRWDPNNGDFEGFTLKQSKWIGEWRKRYLVLKGSKLFFSKSESDTPHGIIDLIDCLSLKSCDPGSSNDKKRSSFEICLKNEKFILTANSEKEKDVWISKISKVRQEVSSIFAQGSPGENDSDNSEDTDDDGR
jgi:hypothetical protein